MVISYRKGNRMARYWSTPISKVPKIEAAETQEETSSLTIHLTGWFHTMGEISIQIRGIKRIVDTKLMATKLPTNLKIETKHI